jgi:putative flippase GtrA
MVQSSAPRTPTPAAPASGPVAERHRFLRYLAVGLANTAFSYGIYALCIAMGMAYFIANLVALVCGICVGFQAHKRLVFKTAGRYSFLYFVAVWAVLYFFNISLIGWLMARGLDAYIAGALALPPTTVLSYGLQRLLVFRGNSVATPTEPPTEPPIEPPQTKP